MTLLMIQIAKQCCGCLMCKVWKYEWTRFKNIDIHVGIRSDISIGQNTLALFMCNMGVTQGEILSSFLFTFILKDILTDKMISKSENLETEINADYVSNRFALYIIFIIWDIWKTLMLILLADNESERGENKKGANISEIHQLKLRTILQEGRGIHFILTAAKWIVEMYILNTQHPTPFHLHPQLETFNLVSYKFSLLCTI